MGVLKKLLYILSVLSLSSCYETFTPDISSKPVLCLNSLIQAGEPIDIKVSHTWLYTNENIEDKGKVEDSVIFIYVNDQEVTLDYIPKEGDIIKIIAESKTYGKAESEVIVPYSPVIKSFDWELTEYTLSTENEIQEENEMHLNFNFNLNIRLTLSDNYAETNYYNLKYKPFYKYDFDNNEENIEESEINQYVWLMIGSLRYESEPLFFEHIEQTDAVIGEPSGIPFFTDRQFSGSEYTLNLQFTGGKLQATSEIWDNSLLNSGIELTLNSISKSYYDWEMYYIQSNSSILGDLTNLGFSDPIWGYSNVSTGAGVVAAKSSIKFIINLKKFIEENLDN